MCCLCGAWSDDDTLNYNCICVTSPCIWPEYWSKHVDENIVNKMHLLLKCICWMFINILQIKYKNLITEIRIM